MNRTTRDVERGVDSQRDLKTATSSLCWGKVTGEIDTEVSSGGVKENGRVTSGKPSGVVVVLTSGWNLFAHLGSGEKIAFSSRAVSTPTPTICRTL